ncbi:hypothetical protein OV208_02120 [Corallococcus sp. bb12-1]|uniref:hypothetical protein n=1 Tax=Corallococcus sp. bb12-1 TaxID=2996784 RepID=UPI002270FFDA|nr:hypothetical protein [Corallococcus sp. bb12-1]MCY1040101.1 hypothetical protein [Corallococcus sp. bb12-1]
MSKLRHLVFALSMPAVLWGCGPEDLPSEMPVPTAATVAEEAPAMLDSQAQELAATAEYTWSQSSSGSTALGATAGRACFLTRVGGDFEGGGERVDIFESGGSWYLGGASSQSGINGASRCVSVAGYSAQYEWTQASSYPVYMGSATNRVCYLTGLAGKLNGGGEWVHAYVSGGDWYLSGNTNQTTLKARARCITVDSYTDESTWSQGASATLLGAVTNRSCALTYVKGKFEGGGEYVRTYQSNGYWYLGGSSGQVSVAGRSRCF